MPNDNYATPPFDGEYRAEGKPSEKKYHVPEKAKKVWPEAESPAEVHMPEKAQKVHMEAESSPVVTYVQPQIQFQAQVQSVQQPPMQPQPMPKPMPQAKQYTYMQYEVEEEKIEIDSGLFAAHPMHHCPNICEHIKDCMLTCERTMHMLMCRPDAYMRSRQIAMLQDCAEVCFLTTRQVARRSPMLKTALRYCAKVCRMCGHECMRYPDPESQACARMCLHCAAVCEKFIRQQDWA